MSDTDEAFDEAFTAYNATHNPPGSEDPTEPTEDKVTPIEAEYKYFDPYPVQWPDPKDSGIIEYTDKGTPMIVKNAIVDYLRACRIVYDNGTPYRFDGRIYRRIQEQDVAKIVYDILDDVGAACPTRSNVKDITEKFKLTCTEIYRPESWEEYCGPYETTGDNYLFAFRNGIFNAETNELLPFTPYLFITSMFQCEYDPRVIEDAAEAVYQGIIPDGTTRRFFYEMVGYILFTRHPTVPALFIIYGGGNTGKSALQSAISAVVGHDQVSTLDLCQISNEYMRGMMIGKTVNFCGETGDRNREYTQVDGELMKKLAEGQEISVNVKYGQPIRMKPTAKMVFVSNTQPDFGDSSSGLHRRIYVLPCRKTQNWKAQIYRALTTEKARSWLVNRAYAAYRAVLQRGNEFTISSAMAEEKAQFVAQDNISDYIATRYEGLTKDQISGRLDGQCSTDVYEDYCEYSQTVGSKPYSRKKFVEKIRNEYDLSFRVVAYVNTYGVRSTRKLYIRN